MLLWAGGVDGAFVTYHAADDVADRYELTGTEVEAWRLVDAIAHQVVAGP
jgi:hypothetical protein